MRLAWCGLVALLLTGPLFAQEPVTVPVDTGIPVQATGAENAPLVDAGSEDSLNGRGCLTGDKGFRNFIGYVSNPTLAVDPRSLTQVLPVYDYVSTRALRRLIPAGEFNVLGPALSIAVTERLNVGLTNGGYVFTSFPRHRSGWLDIGGYAQYTVIRDVPNQFLATVGLGWTVPSGSSSIFQGAPPAYLAPYVTVGKEFGDFHVLSTTGFKFPAGSGKVESETFYGTVHLDRRCFGWLYPLVEFNWTATAKNVNLDLPFVPDIIGLDSFTATGAIITIAPGLNAVLIQDKLEIGAVYQTPIASQNHIHFNAFLVKMVLRY